MTRIKRAANDGRMLLFYMPIWQAKEQVMVPSANYYKIMNEQQNNLRCAVFQFEREDLQLLVSLTDSSVSKIVVIDQYNKEWTIERAKS